MFSKILFKNTRLFPLSDKVFPKESFKITCKIYNTLKPVMQQCIKDSSDVLSKKQIRTGLFIF